MQPRHVVHPFEPIFDARSRVLILGSVPSVKSVENDFYYMHPKNRFWRVASMLFEVDLVSADKVEKAQTLLSHGVALFDSVKECDILGSSDLHIKNAVPQDIPALISGSEIKRIVCNGKKSYYYLTKFFPELKEMAVEAPSTSPANAQKSLDDLFAAYKAALEPFLI